MLVSDHLHLSGHLILASLLAVLRQLVGVMGAGMLGLGLPTSVASVAWFALVFGGGAITRALERSLRQLSLLLLRELSHCPLPSAAIVILHHMDLRLQCTLTL